MKKRFKRLLPVFLIIFMLIPFVLTAQPNIEEKISSGLQSDQVISDLDLPIVPKVNSYGIDKDGNKIPLKTKAIHKLNSKTTQNGETHYKGQTNIEVSVNIKEVTKPSIAQRLLANTAYAYSGSGTDINPSTITQYETAYWDYVYGSSGNLKYYKWTRMEGYWTRGETRYYAHDAYFEAAAMGVKLDGSPFTATAQSSTYYPVFPTSNYYTSNTISWTNGSWLNWPNVYPSESFAARLYGTVYGPNGYIVTVDTAVGWGT